MNKDYIFICLHCNNEFIININDFNCKILRHGIYKNNLQQINQHSSKEECKKLRELINDSFDILDIFFALIGHEPTQEDVEKVYKDYAVDNETDYVFKTQISKESIEKIETSSLSKLSLEDIRLGRF